MLLAVTGLGAWTYVDSVPLPADPSVPQASDIFFSDGHTLLARVGVTDRSDVTLDQVPLSVRHAVLAAEDRTVSRKAKEMALAIKVERRYSKDEILDRYLNTIYFGRGAYGIAAAAQAYFAVPVGRLTAAQGAVLAAVIKDPWNFDPSVDPDAARDRWQWITASMVALGWLPPAPLTYPAVLAEAPIATTTDGVNGLVVGQVEQELDRLGIAPQLLRTGGLRVTSTIDAHDQQSALSAVAAGRMGLDPAIHVALVATDPATGAVLAYYGGDHGSGYFDDATAARRPASTFKPIVLAAGLARGVSYQSTWDGRSPRSFADRGGVPLKNADNRQCPVCRLDTAMVASLNTPFCALTSQLGGSVVRAEALTLGIPAMYDHRPSLMDSPGDPRPGRTRADIALGIYPVTPADLAGVYATFASGGVRTEQHFVAAVTDHDAREVLYRNQPVAVQVIAPAVAADVSAVLAEVAQGDRLAVDRPAAAKTGTQQWGNTTENQDAWLAGYTPQLAAVVWVGRPVPGPIDDAAGVPIEGGTVPAAIWTRFATDALSGQPPLAFPPPAHLGRNAGDAHPAAPTPASAPATHGTDNPSPSPTGVTTSPSPTSGGAVTATSPPPSKPPGKSTPPPSKAP
jgi:membrane peptidoglycan carboxypeptidase